MSGAQDAAVAVTRRWLQEVVIGLSLCPFAAAPFKAGRVSYTVCEETAQEAIYQAFLSTLYELFTSDPADNETALLIVSRGLTSFDDYLDVLETLEQAVVESGADGMVQIASFHPDYCFDGAAHDDPANYTNRSPLPMFHLIREDGLAAALESFPDPEAIPARNVERLRALGLDGIRQLLARCNALSDG